MKRNSLVHAAWITTATLALGIACNQESQRESNTPNSEVNQPSMAANDRTNQMGAQADTTRGMSDGSNTSHTGASSDGEMGTASDGTSRSKTDTERPSRDQSGRPSRDDSTSPSTGSRSDSPRSRIPDSTNGAQQMMGSGGATWGSGGASTMMGGRHGHGTGGRSNGLGSGSRATTSGRNGAGR